MIQRRCAVVRSLSIAFVVVALAGCATTVDDEETTDAGAGVAVDSTVPEATAPIVGTAADLLPRIVDDMGRLSEAIVGDGDADPDVMVARIEATWEAIRDEIETTRPELLSGMQASVEMARTAVDTNRPADADKAFVILTDLIDAFERAA